MVRWWFRLVAHSTTQPLPLIKFGSHLRFLFWNLVDESSTYIHNCRKTRLLRKHRPPPPQEKPFQSDDFFHTPKETSTTNHQAYPSITSAAQKSCCCCPSDNFGARLCSKICISAKLKVPSPFRSKSYGDGAGRRCVFVENKGCWKQPKPGKWSIKAGAGEKKMLKNYQMCTSWDQFEVVDNADGWAYARTSWLGRIGRNKLKPKPYSPTNHGLKESPFEKKNNITYLLR